MRKQYKTYFLLFDINVITCKYQDKLQINAM